MAKNNQKKSNLLKSFGQTIKLQWQLTGWKSFISPTIDVVGNLLSISQAFIYAEIINLLTKFVGKQIDSVFPTFWFLIATLLLIELLQPAFQNIGSYYDNKLRVISENRFNQIVSKKISQLDAEHFENTEYQNLISRVNGLNAGWALRNLSTIISDIITFIIAAVAVFSLNWIIFVLALISSYHE